MMMRWLFVFLIVLNGIYWLYLWRLPPAQPVAEAAPPAAVATGAASLQLLAERPPPPREDPVLERLPEVAVEPPPVPACLMLGPFAEMVSGRQVMERLRALDFAASLYRISVPGVPDYWVHIPPLPSRQAALTRLRELQAQGIESFVITEGDLVNGISLGLFSRQHAALTLAERHRRQGLEVDVREIPRMQSQIWLILEDARPSDLPDELWERLRRGAPGAERQMNDCEVIATAEKLE